MPYEVGWLIENRMVNVRFHGVVTAEDVRGQTAQTFALIETGVPPVHVLLDSTDVESVGIGIGDLRGLSSPTRPEAGWTIIIAPNTLYRFFISVGMQFTGSDYKFVRSPQEALEFVRQRDPTMPAASGEH